MTRVITRTRRETSTRLRGLEIPDAFMDATVAAAARATYQKNARDARRLADKVRRILMAASLTLTACGGIVDTSVTNGHEIEPVTPHSAADRFANAVCACGNGWEGCYANVFHEARGLAAIMPVCLDAMAAGYEIDCSGRSRPNGCEP